MLFVGVILGDNCGGSGVLVQSVNAGPTPMTLVDSEIGLPNCNTSSQVQIWQLSHPPIDPLLPITVALDAPIGSLHSAAYDFVGVDLANPIRATAKGNGDPSSATSVLTVDSEPGDLVFDIIGQGKGLTGTGGAQTKTFTANNSMGFTLDNSGGSTMVGADLASMVWQFVGPDYWASIGVALRPAQ